MKSKKSLSKQKKEDLQLRERKILELRQEFKKRQSDLSAFFGDDLASFADTFTGLKISEEGWIRKGLEKWENDKIKIPKNKYRDTAEDGAKFQQSFMEYVRQICPDVISELKKFSQDFKTLFELDQTNYLDVFEKLKTELAGIALSLRQDKGSSLNFEFLWGDCYLLLGLSFLLKDETNPICEDASLQKWIESEKYTVLSAERVIHKHFDGRSSDKENLVLNFLALQIGLLRWAKRHNLQKDWILNYAYYLIWQFCNDPRLTTENIKIEVSNKKSFHTPDFELSVRGWMPSKESKKDYEKLIKEQFEIRLKAYFNRVYRDLELDNKTIVTKPIDFSRVRWLIYWTVLGWGKDQIRSEMDSYHQKYDTGASYEDNTLDKYFREFNKYGLPVR